MENNKILKEIKLIHKDSMKKSYGSIRITEELNSKDYTVGHNRIARIMKENNITATPRRKYKTTTDSNHNNEVSENILNRNFTASKTNQKWVSDITYIPTNEGWLFLCVILDLYSRKVVGWSMRNNLKKDIVMDALNMAINNREVNKDLIFHSDRGVQYTSNLFRATINNLEFIQSMSRKGNCWDNAVAESFFHTLKTEKLQFERFKTRKEAQNCIFEYIEVFYNKIRRHSYLGYDSPEMFEMKKCA